MKKNERREFLKKAALFGMLGSRGIKIFPGQRSGLSSLPGKDAVKSKFLKNKTTMDVMSSFTSSGKEIRAGFGKNSLRSCIISSTPFRKDLEVVTAVIDTPENRVVIVALDLLELSPEECATYQKEISTRLNIPENNILIHTTHTHSAPWDERYQSTQYSASRFTGVSEIISKTIARAIASAEPVLIRYGETNVGQSLSVYRRGYAGPNLGFQTFWFGYTYHPGDDRPDASALVNEMESRWANKTPSYVSGNEPVWFDRPVDPLIQTVTFETLKGKPIGTLVRFSAHPHLASACTNKWYDPDFPGIVRETVEKQLGGICMFLLGTCANIVPKEKVEYRVVPEKSPRPPYLGPNWAFEPVKEEQLLEEMRRIGKAIADAALKGLGKNFPIALQQVTYKTWRQPVALDPCLPQSMEELSRMQKPLVAEYMAFLRAGKPLASLQLLANRLNWLEWAGKKSLGVLLETDRKRGEKEMPLSILCLNNIKLVFMHSEIPMETSLSLRENFPGMPLITVSMTGGSLEYIATDEMLDEGGYEGRSTIIAYGAEKEMRNAIMRELNHLT